MYRLVHILAALLMLASCARVSPALREASSLIEDHPDSALYLLDAIPRERLASDREKAEYDYLTAYSFYKTYYFLDDSSEAALQRSCLYFEAHGPNVERMRAWELMGTVQTASARHGSGLVSFRKAEMVAREIERSRIRLQTLSLLVLSILATLVLYFWARKSQMEKLLLQEKQENERILSAAEELRSSLSRLQSKNAAAKPAFAGLDTLDRLCEQYYVYEGTSSLQPKILKEVRSIVEGLRSDERVRKQLEQSLNASSDDVMKRLRAAFPKWKEEDYSLYLFTAAGFSSTTISTLLEKDKPYVYNRLYRLKERLRPSPDGEFFLSVLEK